jgi:riboflavin kinase/FMN adenylyltransferase
MRVTECSEVVSRPRRVAVGEFDGVHLGHRAVIEGSDTVLTFEPHPLAVTRPELAPKLLTSLELKVELLSEIGIEELVVIRFDDDFAHQTAEQFIDDVLVGRLGATSVSIGANFRFGHRAAGDTALLSADPRFQTRVVPLVELSGEIVSSSHIRTLLQAGEVARAAEFLVAPFRLRGEVVHGDARGRELGFPTANLIPDDELICPGHGIYAARCDGVAAAVSIGVRPTFGNDLTPLVEAYLLDTDEDLYGRTLTLEFIEKLRGEQRFDSVEALVAQMNDDVRRTRQIVESAGTR